MKNKASSFSIWTALIAVYLIWGSTYLAIRFAVETLPPFLMASTRFLVAGGLLYTFRRLRGDAAPTKIEWRSSLIIGFFLLVGGNGGVTFAETRVVSGIAALMVACVPLWIVLFELVLNRGGSTAHGKVTPVVIIGVLVGFAGLVLLVGPSSLTGFSGGIDPLGAGILVLATLSWSIGSLYSRKAALPSSPLLGTGMEMLAGGVGTLLVGTLLGEWSQVHLSVISLRSLEGLGYLIVFGSLIGYASYTWLLRNAPTTLVSTYAYVNPVVALFLGNWFDREPLTPRVLIAAAIILCAVVLITFTQPSRTKVEESGPVVYSSGDD